MSSSGQEEAPANSASDSESAELAASLLKTAGLGTLVTIERFDGYSNAHHLVTGSDGGRYVLRRFKENALPHTALARMQRECWAYRQLAQAGVPVPLVVATSEETGAEAALVTFTAGEHLGTAVPLLTAAGAVQAWSSCGRAIAAAHSIDSRQAEASGCELIGIHNPYVSRGPWHYEEALTHLDRLALARPDLGPLDELTAAVIEALPLYEQAPLALCQYDAHLWQYLIASNGHEWECVAILDWEHADLDDPDWDLAQLDGFRFGPNGGLVPRSFFAGYGRTLSSPLHTLYRLERAAWILAGHAEGGRGLSLSVPLAESLIRGLLARPSVLRDAIDRMT